MEVFDYGQNMTKNLFVVQISYAEMFPQKLLFRKKMRHYVRSKMSTF